MSVILSFFAWLKSPSCLLLSTYLAPQASCPSIDFWLPQAFMPYSYLSFPPIFSAWSRGLARWPWAIYISDKTSQALNIFKPARSKLTSTRACRRWDYPPAGRAARAVRRPLPSTRSTGTALSGLFLPRTKWYICMYVCTVLSMDHGYV